mgnify:FL=1
MMLCLELWEEEEDNNKGSVSVSWAWTSDTAWTWVAGLEAGQALVGFSGISGTATALARCKASLGPPAAVTLSPQRAPETSQRLSGNGDSGAFVGAFCPAASVYRPLPAGFELKFPDVRPLLRLLPLSRSSCS